MSCAVRPVRPNCDTVCDLSDQPYSVIAGGGGGAVTSGRGALGPQIIV
jgi:hypothetical protein